MSDTAERVLKSLFTAAERPIEDPCPRCGERALVVIQVPGWGPWGGAVECRACSKRNSVVGHLGQQMIQVEPLEEDEEA